MSLKNSGELGKNAQVNVSEYILRVDLGEFLRLATQRYFDFLTGMYGRFAKRDLILQRLKRAHSGAAIGVGMVLIPQIMGPQGQAKAPAAPLVICPNCHAYVPATSKFCPECGTSLRPPAGATIICPKCGHSIPASSKFCPECGTQLSQRTT